MTTLKSYVFAMTSLLRSLLSMTNITASVLEQQVDHIPLILSCPPRSQALNLTLLWVIYSTLLPIVGVVYTAFPKDLDNAIAYIWQRIVVFPAFAKPRIRMLQLFADLKSLFHMDEKNPPIFLNIDWIINIALIYWPFQLLSQRKNLICNIYQPKAKIIILQLEMLNPSKRHVKSLSCTLIQKQIQANHKEAITGRRASNPEFVPFCLERKLGKLILKDKQQPMSKQSNEQLLEKITFRNFHKIYRIVNDFEQKKYSKLTRKSEQKNLLNKQWKVKSLSKLPQRYAPTSSRVRVKIVNKQSIHSQRQKFQKMNEHLYKKLSKINQPSQHPDLKDMYQNYIKICELNQNIRRGQLIKGIKDKL